MNVHARPHFSDEPHRGFARLFSPGRLTLGLTFPIEAYAGDTPRMDVPEQVRLAQRAEALGYAALWVRDIPLHDPAFGDVGQIHDPWVWLGYLAPQTHTIALATGSVILPLRHPIDLAKASASLDRLSGGRLVLGVATSDRPVEYPAYGIDPDERAERFRDGIEWLRRLQGEVFPRITSPLGALAGGDLIPKPVHGRVPLIVTGHSRQSLAWTAAHSDAWLMYPRPPEEQHSVVAAWRAAVREAVGEGRSKPFAQSLYVDLTHSPTEGATRIHLGYRLGRQALVDHLGALQEAGVGHVLLNLKLSQRPVADVLEEIGTDVLPFVSPPSDSVGAARTPTLA